MTKKKAYRANLTLPDQLKNRVEAQLALTGFGFSEFLRYSLLEKLEALEAKQAEKRLMDSTASSGFLDTGS